MSASGAAAGGVLLLDPGGTRVEAFIIDGESNPGAVADAHRLSLEQNMPIFDAARTGQAVCLRAKPKSSRDTRAWPRCGRRATRRPGAPFR
jgi:hypothetical protein